MTPEPARRIALSGASGFLGSALAAALAGEGLEVARLVRRRPRTGSNEIEWHPDRGRIDREALEGVAAVVNLNGENIGRRWSTERKRRMWSSRVDSTDLLARTLASLRRPPEVLVSASAVGIYGANRGDELLDEASRPGTDFLARMAVEWERAAEPAVQAGIRVVHPRFGVVLGGEGGVLKRLLPPFRLGLGARLGSGSQWLSWVALDDAIRAIRFLMDTPALAGPVNVAAPEPVTNSEFTRALADALRRPALLAVPAGALKALLGEMAEATLLGSQRVIPRRLLDAGFGFRFPRIDQALAQSSLA